MHCLPYKMFLIIKILIKAVCTMKYKNGAFFYPLDNFLVNPLGQTHTAVKAALLWYGGGLSLCDPQFTGVSSVSEPRCSAVAFAACEHKGAPPLPRLSRRQWTLSRKGWDDDFCNPRWKWPSKIRSLPSNAFLLFIKCYFQQMYALCITPLTLLKVKYGELGPKVITF